MTVPSSATAGPPALIYIIRHGEKPADPPTPTAVPNPPFGVDVNGNQSIHSLLPRGWQRSGALAVLFAPAVGPPQAGLRTPMTLFSPDYGDPDKTQEHRTYETIQGLSGRLKVPINSPFAEGQESALASAVVADYAGVVLIRWEHQHIPAIAAALPTVSGTQIPAAWPGDRFDAIWSFTLQPGASPAEYVSQKSHSSCWPATPPRFFKFKGQHTDDPPTPSVGSLYFCAAAAPARRSRPASPSACTDNSSAGR